MYRIVKLIGVLLLLVAGSAHSAIPVGVPSLAPMLERVNPAVVEGERIGGEAFTDGLTGSPLISSAARAPLHFRPV